MGTQYLLFIYFCMVGWSASPTLDQPGYIKVTVSGIKRSTGTIRVAIVDETSYERNDAVGYGGSVKVLADEKSVQFLSGPVPPGAYAVKVFHDENDNAKLDFNRLGIPQEPYGFSNNARGWFGPPSFQAAAIHVEANVTTEVLIDL